VVYGSRYTRHTWEEKDVSNSKAKWARAAVPEALCGEMVADGFLSVAAAAAFLGVSRAKLYQLMDAGELSYAKFGKSRRIPKRGLHEYAAKCLIGVAG
jgi:excisionase family DNA binding protein